LASSAQKIECEWPELAIALYHHRNTLGEPMMFARPGRRWAIPLYKDKAHTIIVMKSVQCGVTEWLIVKMAASVWQGKSILYALPTQDIRNDFVNNRIDPLFSDVEFYARMSTRTDNTGLKKFKTGGGVKFVGSQTRTVFREYPAQIFIADEYDICDMSNINYGMDRLAAAKALTGVEPYVYFVSNPSVAGFGIAEKFDQSDKKYWHVKCPHCNEWQTIDWFKNIVRQTDDNTFSLRDLTHNPSNGSGGEPCAFCRFCNKQIDRLSRGEWVAEYPDRDVSGYQISSLFTDQLTITWLWDYFTQGLRNATVMQQFWNSYLGLPYSGEGDKITYDVLAACSGNYKMPATAKATVAGIDVGKVFHLVVSSLQSGKIRDEYIGTCPDVPDLLKKLKQYGVNRYIIDAGPELHTAKAIIKKHPGGFLCRYNTSESPKGQKIDLKERVITPNRTESIDKMVAAYMDKLIMIPASWHTISNGDYASQMMAPTRILDDKRRPPVFVWDEGSQADHFFHASNYRYMAAEMMGFSSRPFGGMII